MGTKYTTESVSGYNATPPADDGTVSEANKVKWSTIKTKVTDPLNTAIANIDSKLTTHFNNGPTALTTNTTLDSTHYNKIVQVSGSGVTLTLTDASTLGAGWFCDIVSTDASNNVALSRANASNTINETSADVTILSLQALKVIVNAAATGFLVDTKARHSKNYKTAEATTMSGQLTMSGKPIIQAEGAAIASAATCDIWTPADGDTVHITGTTTITSFGTAPQAGAYKRIIFDGTLTLTHGANLNLPGGANIITGANDSCLVYADTTTQMDILSYTSATGLPVIGPTASQGASLVLLDSQTISGVASISVTSKITSTYDDYVWIGENILIANDNDTMTFQGSKDNNSTNEAANYWIGNPNGAMSAGSVAIASLNNSSTLPMDFNLQLFNPLRTATSKTWLWKGSYPLTGTGVQNTFDKHCMWNETGAGKFFNAFKLSVGSTMSGTFKFYGIRKT